jgi:hypothetical protein
MLQLNSLAIGLLSAISIVPTAQAFTPISDYPLEIAQPAQNLHAQLTIIIGNGGIPHPQPVIIEKTVIVETRRRNPEPEYRSSSRWQESRNRREKFSKHNQHSHHRQNRDDNRYEYQSDHRGEHRH